MAVPDRLSKHRARIDAVAGRWIGDRKGDARRRRGQSRAASALAVDRVLRIRVVSDETHVIAHGPVVNENPFPLHIAREAGIDNASLRNHEEGQACKLLKNRIHGLLGCRINGENRLECRKVGCLPHVKEAGPTAARNLGVRHSASRRGIEIRRARHGRKSGRHRRIVPADDKRLPRCPGGSGRDGFALGGCNAGIGIAWLPEVCRRVAV